MRIPTCLQPGKIGLTEPKRKRGRPRKNPEQPVKRKRGRPPKNPPPPPPRKRGRPPKPKIDPENNKVPTQDLGEQEAILADIIDELSRGKKGGASKYDGERAARVVKYVLMGNYKSVAAAAVGINPDTLARWKDKHPAFDTALEMAEAQAEIFHVGRAGAGVMNWQSSAWWLERARPSRWSKRDMVEIEDEPERDKVIDVDGFKIVIKPGSTADDLADALPPPVQPCKKNGGNGGSN